ncbi:procathepsin L [Xenopus laevis]|uniref:Uncharacterized protein n=2 Tax=Xenopus laevis TaxID=8355 RepID=A0A974H8R9_XENLA|nr:procathepsin L [Xenopus laevis]OCT69032.1 hypothetical protein XELAEV_18040340mg [Xenopus laevis]
MGPSTIFLVSLFSLLIPAHSAPDPTLDSHWQLWVKSHQKTYKDAEEEGTRRTIWEETLKYITVHNLEYSLGLHTYEVGMNHLGDMTGEEVAATMTGYISSDHSLANVTHVPKEILKARPPASKDWRTEGCVTPVRDQGSCGSCYAFSTVGALECQWKLKTRRLVTFSPQELVDCSYTEGNNGCEGGNLYYSFRYMNEFGVMEDSDYPYKEKEETCKKHKPNGIGVIKAVKVVPSGNEIVLMKAVGTVGPVSVAIDASRQGFRMYKSGVYYDPFCKTTSMNHAVLVVGYGRENDMSYWLVKNSWGVGFGDQGYIKMARERDNHCGIARGAAYPVV